MNKSDLFIQCLLITLVISALIAVPIFFLGRYLFVKERREEEKLKGEEDNEGQVWSTYCLELEKWFQSNQQSFLPSELTLKQIQILYAMAGLEFSKRLRFWQILMLWGCDVAGHSRLRFDVEWEKLIDEHLVFESGGCESLPQLKRAWALSDKGRDFLIAHRLI